jgi:sulfoxide reductase heme-binding subunit YedZ
VDASQRAAHRPVPPSEDAHVQRLRGPGGVDVRRDGPEEELLKRLGKPVVFVAALLPAAWIAWKFLHDQLGANPIRELEIETGLWTLRFLAITLAVSPLRRATGWNWMQKYRRMLGLFTFFYATVHLSMWVGVDWFFAWGDMWGEIVKHRYILIGMLTWLIMVPLAITSTKGWVRRLGKRWTKLHRLVYVAAITGTIHYLWAVKKDTFFPLVYLATFVLLLAYRVIAARQRSSHGARPRSGASAAA